MIQEKDKGISPGEDKIEQVQKRCHKKSPQYSVSFSINSFRFGWLIGICSPEISSIPAIRYDFSKGPIDAIMDAADLRCTGVQYDNS